MNVALLSPRGCMTVRWCLKTYTWKALDVKMDVQWAHKWSRTEMHGGTRRRLGLPHFAFWIVCDCSKIHMQWWTSLRKVLSVVASDVECFTRCLWLSIKAAKPRDNNFRYKSPRTHVHSSIASFAGITPRSFLSRRFYHSKQCKIINSGYERHLRPLWRVHVTSLAKWSSQCKTEKLRKNAFVFEELVLKFENSFRKMFHSNFLDHDLKFPKSAQRCNLRSLTKIRVQKFEK